MKDQVASGKVTKGRSRWSPRGAVSWKVTGWLGAVMPPRPKPVNLYVRTRPSVILPIPRRRKRGTAKIFGTAPNSSVQTACGRGISHYDEGFFTE